MTLNNREYEMIITMSSSNIYVNLTNGNCILQTRMECIVFVSSWLLYVWAVMLCCASIVIGQWALCPNKMAALLLHQSQKTCLSLHSKKTNRYSAFSRINVILSLNSAVSMHHLFNSKHTIYMYKAGGFYDSHARFTTKLLIAKGILLSLKVNNSYNLCPNKYMQFCWCV